ncbi:MAG TPA: ABC transporter permease [Acholeplasmataceae bacterium]|nr:ABC transporter permease [Acholeplasmataceae bacterium]
MKTKLTSKIFVGLVLAFIYIPIISMVVFSFNSSRSLTRWTGFSFMWYQELFTDEVIIRAVLVTIIIAVLSTVISTIIGTLASIALSKQRKVIREAALSLNNIPVLNPEIITAVSLFLLFGAFAIERGYLTMLLAHIAFSVPYVVIAVYPKVRSLDPNLTDAAYDLGATPFQAIYKVILPQIKVAIIAGAAIAFTMSFDDFAISYFAVSDTSIQNISIYLYTLRRGVEPTINALSTIIILIIMGKVVYDTYKIKKIKTED